MPLPTLNHIMEQDNLHTVQTTSTLWKQPPYCENNLYTVKTTSTLWKQPPHCENNLHTVKTTSILWKQPPYCENNLHTVKTTSILWKQLPHCLLHFILHCAVDRISSAQRKPNNGRVLMNLPLPTYYCSYGGSKKDHNNTSTMGISFHWWHCINCTIQDEMYAKYVWIQRWQVTCDRLHVTRVRWQVTGDKRQVTSERWQMTRDRWQVTDDKRQMTSASCKFIPIN